MNTTEFINIAAEICPNRSFLTFEGKSQTFRQTIERINSLAYAMKKMGIRKGDRIGMLNVNCPQYVESYFAGAKIGAIFVPLNFRAKADELAYLLGHAGVRVLLSGSRYAELLKGILPRLSELKNLICVDDISEEWLHYEELISTFSSAEVFDEIENDGLTILMYTSGTSGKPKAVPLTHQGFVSYVLDNVEPANPEIEERNLLTVPLYHVAGIQAMIAGAYGGRNLVLMPQFEVKKWLQTVQEERVSRSMLVPTMLKWIIDDPEFSKFDLSSLQVISYGAAPMPFEVIKKAIDKMPWVHFINAFGQTETASTISVLGPDDHRIEGTVEQREKKLHRLANSIGRPLSDVEIKIVDADGKRLAPLETGEIFARGSRIMSGYWGDVEKTKNVLTDDGWLRTGDCGWMDEDGYIFLAGRQDDMIIRGGENISPVEVEEVIRSNENVYDCAVIGIANEEWGQEIRAIVELKDGKDITEEELIEFCRGRLAGFKRPKSFIFVDELPRTPMGKILKRELRKQHGS